MHHLAEGKGSLQVFTEHTELNNSDLQNINASSHAFHLLTVSCLVSISYGFKGLFSALFSASFRPLFMHQTLPDAGVLKAYSKILTIEIRTVFWKACK